MTPCQLHGSHVMANPAELVVVQQRKGLDVGESKTAQQIRQPPDVGDAAAGCEKSFEVPLDGSAEGRLEDSIGLLDRPVATDSSSDFQPASQPRPEELPFPIPMPESHLIRSAGPTKVRKSRLGHLKWLVASAPNVSALHKLLIHPPDSGAVRPHLPHEGAAAEAEWPAAGRAVEPPGNDSPSSKHPNPNRPGVKWDRSYHDLLLQTVQRIYELQHPSRQPHNQQPLYKRPSLPQQSHSIASGSSGLESKSEEREGVGDREDSTPSASTSESELLITASLAGWAGAEITHGRCAPRLQRIGDLLHAVARSERGATWLPNDPTLARLVCASVGHSLSLLKAPHWLCAAVGRWCRGLSGTEGVVDPTFALKIAAERRRILLWQLARIAATGTSGTSASAAAAAARLGSGSSGAGGTLISPPLDAGCGTGVVDDEAAARTLKDLARVCHSLRKLNLPPDPLGPQVVWSLSLGVCWLLRHHAFDGRSLFQLHSITRAVAWSYLVSGSRPGPGRVLIVPPSALLEELEGAAIKALHCTKFGSVFKILKDESFFQGARNWDPLGQLGPTRLQLAAEMALSLSSLGRYSAAAGGLLLE